MPLNDQVLEILFSFLFEGKGRTKYDLQLAAVPVCRLLQTRRLRGFETVKMEVFRMGLGWAMRAKQFWMRAACLQEALLREEQEWVQMYKSIHWEADRLRLDSAYTDWELRDFVASDNDPQSAM